MRTLVWVALAALATAAAAAAEKHAWFGDLHAHTRYSYDAFFFGTFASPDDAYRFAKGEPLKHPAGIELQLERPLDFYAVADHAYFLGMWWAVRSNPDHPLRSDPAAVEIVAAETRYERGVAYRKAFRFPREKFQPDDMRSTWADIQAAAGRHYDPGTFTTFIAFEFTPEPNMDGLHRNVLYRGTRAPPEVIGRSDTLNPEFLWDWMDRYRAAGMEALAIPHNMNLSNGRMFEGSYFDGSPLDAAYAEQRMRNEPLVEITQVKGTSDTHPALSVNDEWANFEIVPFKLGSGFNKSQPHGSYAREALLNGLRFEAQLGVNPYQFGFIGSSDTHNGGQRYEESNFIGKVGDLTSDPIDRGSVPMPPGGRGQPYPKPDENLSAAELEYLQRAPQLGHLETARRYYSAAGLAGIWAPENTRETLFDALRRKETFGTSGPRITVRFVAADALGGDPDADYRDTPAGGVPQGGDLSLPAGASPQFHAWAMADPSSARLQRLQIVKGWVDDGWPKEKVFDIACADGLTVERDTHRCPDNGATVDLSDCSITEGKGAAMLRATWEDPEFDPHQSAFYYVRVLENPTCRWSTWDAVRAGVLPRPDLEETLQERAWSSPIWVDAARP